MTWRSMFDLTEETMLTLIRGLPGSGKTTIAKSRPGIHIEADQYFMVNGCYFFDRSKLRDAHAWCLRETETALRNGHSVNVSNTFTQHWEMRPYFDLAKRIGVAVEIVEAIGNWPNVHGVPDDVIARMRARWEPTQTDPSTT